MTFQCEKYLCGAGVEGRAGNVSAFRKQIWEKVFCLRERSAIYHLGSVRAFLPSPFGRWQMWS